MIPVVHVGFVCLDQFEFFLGIINQGAELFLLGFAHFVAEDVVHLTLDVTRSVSQYMLERLVLSVQVGQKVFSTLGQVKYGLQVDDFGTCICNRRECLREQLKIPQIRLFFLLVVFHCIWSLVKVFVIFNVSLSSRGSVNIYPSPRE